MIWVLIVAGNCMNWTAIFHVQINLITEQHCDRRWFESGTGIFVVAILTFYYDAQQEYQTWFDKTRFESIDSINRNGDHWIKKHLCNCWFNYPNWQKWKFPTPITEIIYLSIGIDVSDIFYTATDSKSCKILITTYFIGQWKKPQTSRIQ